MSQEDDASYKLLFSSPEVVRDLVTGFIPDAWLHSLDYSTLEKMPGHYVTDDLRQRAGDVVWRVRAGGQWVYLYLLIEFQSTVDHWMPVRIMTYVGLLYQDMIRQAEVLPQKRLPPVLPVVLYNGMAKWTAATDVAQLVPRVPGRVADFLPQMKYLLIEESSYTDAELAKMRNLVAAIMRVEHPASSQALFGLIDVLNDWLADNPELRRTFAIWIRAVVLRRSRHTLVLPKVHDLKELKMTLAERFDTWAEEFKQQGLEQGIVKGEALVLQRLLAKRFGPLPAHVVHTISTASAEQIDTWVDRVLDAPTLHDVLR